jgi:hypothetical protein
MIIHCHKVALNTRRSLNFRATKQNKFKEETKKNAEIAVKQHSCETCYESHAQKRKKTKQSGDSKKVEIAIALVLTSIRFNISFKTPSTGFLLKFLGQKRVLKALIISIR